MKVAVSIPDPIFEAAEALAQQRNMPRSQLFAEALSAYLETHGTEAITAALNRVYDKQDSNLDSDLNQAQLDSIEYEAW